MLLQLAEEILGTDAFGAGFAYGALSEGAHAVGEMLDLARTFALADIYEALNGGFRIGVLPADYALSAFVSVARVVGADRFLRERLRDEYEAREEFKREVWNLVRHPDKALLHAVADYPERWREIHNLLASHGLHARFQAGKKTAELLFEILTALATLIAVGELAVSAAKGATRLVRLARSKCFTRGGSAPKLAPVEPVDAKPAPAAAKPASVEPDPPIAEPEPVKGTLAPDPVPLVGVTAEECALA